MKTDLNINKLNIEIESFEFTGENSYLDSYKEFITYFRNIEKITIHQLYISSHFVYGWMPTIIRLRIADEKRTIKLLNKVRSNQILSIEELEFLKICINNSMVGLSKLLHFINPIQYPIWDSRVFRYLTKKKSQYGISKASNYLEYVSLIEKISQAEMYQNIHDKIESKIKYEVTPARAIELVMFEADKKSNK